MPVDIKISRTNKRGLAAADQTASAGETQRDMNYSQRSASDAHEGSSVASSSTHALTATALCRMQPENDCDETCVYTLDSKLVRCIRHTNTHTGGFTCEVKGGQHVESEGECTHVIKNPSPPPRAARPPTITSYHLPTLPHTGIMELPRGQLAPPYNPIRREEWGWDRPPTLRRMAFLPSPATGDGGVYTAASGSLPPQRYMPHGRDEGNPRADSTK